MSNLRDEELKNIPEEIYMELQIPKEKRELKYKAKEIFVKPKMTNDEILAREGSYFTEKDADVIYDEDVDIYTEDEKGEKKLLAKLRKKVIDPDIVKIGWEGFWVAASPSRMRGAAAGPIQKTSKYWKKRTLANTKGWTTSYLKQDGTVSNMRVNNQVFSAVLGYFNATHLPKLPCRLTTYTRSHWKYFKHGIPFIEAIDECFKKLVPEKHAAQQKAASEKPLLQIGDTAFSSVTVNRNFRTGLHMDDGDYVGGYGNLSVIERGHYHGGFTLFPQYRIGFNVRTGDFLAMDVHQWHCNTALYETVEDKQKNKGLPRIHKSEIETGTLGDEQPFSRVSFVCYLREKLRDCDDKATKSYFKEIGFNPKNMTLEKSNNNKTRKVKKYAE
jgi:hypothetical protein